MPKDLDTMLSVTLDTTTNPWSLDVDQSNNANHFNPGEEPQGIAWTLTGNAASGSFLALDAPEPGFAWRDVPPAGIFDDLKRNPGNTHQLTISDHHIGPGTAGTWVYTLRAQIDGTVYSTITTSPRGQNTDPTIQNN